MVQTHLHLRVTVTTLGGGAAIQQLLALTAVLILHQTQHLRGEKDHILPGEGLTGLSVSVLVHIPSPRLLFYYLLL